MTEPGKAEFLVYNVYNQDDLLIVEGRCVGDEVIQIGSSFGLASQVNFYSEMQDGHRIFNRRIADPVVISLTIQEIFLYGGNMDWLDPGLTARLTLVGDCCFVVRKNTLLIVDK